MMLCQSPCLQTYLPKSREVQSLDRRRKRNSTIVSIVIISIIIATTLTPASVATNAIPTVIAAATAVTAC